MSQTIHPSAVKYHYQTVAKLVRAVDRQEAAIASGDNETVAKIGRRLYSNGKALKHHAYSSAHVLDDYVTGGMCDASGIRCIDDLRSILRATNVYYNLGRSTYRG